MSNCPLRLHTVQKSSWTSPCGTIAPISSPRYVRGGVTAGAVGEVTDAVGGAADAVGRAPHTGQDQQVLWAEPPDTVGGATRHRGRGKATLWAEPRYTVGGATLHWVW